MSSPSQEIKLQNTEQELVPSVEESVSDANKDEETSEDDSSESSSNPNSPSGSASDTHEPSQITPDELHEDRISDTSSEQGNCKTSRELKSILALSKEANLDTNISYKRKSSEITKHREAKDGNVNVQGDVESSSRKLIKHNSDFKITKFPVTAESELESSVVTTSSSNKVTEKINTDNQKRKTDSSSEAADGATDGVSRIKKSRQSTNSDDSTPKMQKDVFCWRCHREGVNVSCETCPRSYHHKCLKQSIPDSEHWPCPECVSILKAESTQTRSEAMKGMTLEHLCGLLKFALKRMIRCQDSQPFMTPVSEVDFPDYKKYIVQPMYLSLLEKNIRENLYGSTQAFEADAKWILHNSIIFNSYQSKLTSVAKSIIKICKQEMAEIENCPSCYLNANTKKDTWFVEVCPKPHILVWAKLKGFPFWPAKAMSTNSNGMVDVRFFGAHDRAWVPSKECYLYCRRDPNAHRQKKNDINECVKELEIYIDNLRKVYGEFHYAPFKTPFEPNNELKQLQISLPRYRPDFKPKTTKQKLYLKSSDFNIDSPNSSPEPDLQKPPATTETNEDGDVKKVESLDDSVTPETKEVDNTMEGYGTDDESTLAQVCADSLVKYRRRGSGTETEDDENEERIESEPEEESDPQVLNSLSFDNSPLRGKVRTRGGVNTSTGKLKIFPRLVNSNTDELTPKRVSEDKSEENSNKLMRCNSDHSVKSDSSRLSNISDKINRVDIQENMEITLGNSKIGCLSISEVELKSLESSSQKPSSSLETEKESELKQKPIQVQIQNNELTILPQNKLKVTERLIKRLSETQDAPFIDNSDDKYLPVRPPIRKTTVILSEKKVPVPQESIENETESGKSGDKANNVKSDTEKNTTPQTKENTSGLVTNIIEGVESSSKEIGSSSGVQNVSDEPMEIVSSVIIDKETKCELILNQTILNETTSAPKSSVNRAFELDILPEISSITNSLPPIRSCDSPISNERNSNGSVTREENKKSNNGPSVTELCRQDSREKQQVEDIVKNNDHLRAFVSKSQLDDNSLGTNEIKITQIQSLARRNSSNDITSQVAVIEHVEDSDESLDDSQIDEANIRNIIHSSLNETSNSSKFNHVEQTLQPSQSTNTPKRKTPDADESLEKNQPTKLMRLLSKSSDNSEDVLESPTHRTTIVRSPISLSKGTVQKNLSVIKESSKIFTNSQRNHMINKEVGNTSKNSSNAMLSEKSNKNTSQRHEEPMIVEIKSEPESDSEDQDNDTEYMEAKRQYMSALNISEKQEDSLKSRTPEIRTRSKTEEFRFKPIDNISRIINEVATNYSSNINIRDMSITAKEIDKSNNIDEHQIYVKPLSQMQEPHRQRARKSFPKPNYSAPPRLPSQQKPTKNDNMHYSLLKKQIPVQNIAVEKSKTVDPLSTPPNLILLSQPQSLVSNVAILPPNQTISYNANMGSPVLAVVSQASATPTLVTKPVLLKPKNVNFTCSQNYIPQNESTGGNQTPSPLQTTVEAATATTSTTTSNTSVLINNLLNNSIVSSTNQMNGTSNDDHESTVPATSDEFTILNGILPDNICKEVSNLLVRPPPKLKPRPPGPLGTTFEECTPSSAGPVTAKINSIAHRLSDYFRGMIIELLEEIGKTDNKEATISLLKSEIEAVKHTHSVEISEIKKNLCTTLKDIQKSIVEDRERIIDETRASCEAEAIKRIEEAKSKQWCANCSKEAQFYCCWNTSYCDYPCQQKHWAKHMNKCTQNSNNQQATAPAMRSGGPQYVIRQSTSKDARRIVSKPTKVYVNRGLVAKNITNYKTTTGGQLTLVESTPGNFELQGLGPIAVSGKILATSIVGKVKSTNVMTATSPSTSCMPGVTSNTSKVSSVIHAKSPPSIVSARNIASLSDDSD